MLEIILLSVAFIGSLAAGLWDLKTTEIPDEVPTLMAALGIFIWFVSDISILALSLAFGTAFLLFGWLLYKAGQWGGGDAKLLSATGFLLPSIGGQLFALNFLFNLFIVGLGYMVVYSLALGILNRNVFTAFWSSLAKDKPVLASTGLVAILLIATIITQSYLEFPSMVWMLVLVFFLLFFWKYSKTIEEKVFKKKIPVSQLRVGDVIVESKQWDGITEEELKKIKKSGKKFVVIKEGVRFGLVFFITIIVTLLFGNLIFSFVGL
ncbi:MAG: prepilin peptidase [Candidatus Aenigmarchaeota archaeon]|nr:prepilin peptidase [Candidatus Aenigmarchaeota archaeon]